MFEINGYSEEVGTTRLLLASVLSQKLSHLLAHLSC